VFEFYLLKTQLANPSKSQSHDMNFARALSSEFTLAIQALAAIMQS
jgi:hypothetical protein